MAQTRKRKANRSGKGASKQPLVSVRKPDSRRFLIFGGLGIVALVAIIGILVIVLTLPSDNPVVVMVTSKGTIKIELYQDKAPITVKNFLQYVENRHYDGTVFHRVIDNFMIQGGGFDSRLQEKPSKEPITNESNNGVRNERGTVAMARTGDPNSATAQFYINVADNSGLDGDFNTFPPKHGYAVFGRVIEGMDVVDAIKGVATGVKICKMLDPESGELVARPSKDVPLENVVIKSIRRAK